MCRAKRIAFAKCKNFSINFFHTSSKKDMKFAQVHKKEVPSKKFLRASRKID